MRRVMQEAAPCLASDSTHYPTGLPLSRYRKEWRQAAAAARRHLSLSLREISSDYYTTVLYRGVGESLCSQDLAA